MYLKADYFCGFWPHRNPSAGRVAPLSKETPEMFQTYTKLRLDFWLLIFLSLQRRMCPTYLFDSLYLTVSVQRLSDDDSDAAIHQQLDWTEQLRLQVRETVDCDFSSNFLLQMKFLLLTYVSWCTIHTFIFIVSVFLPTTDTYIFTLEEYLYILVRKNVVAWLRVVEHAVDNGTGLDWSSCFVWCLSSS